MRISTNTLYAAGTTRITDLQSAMQRTQQQIATGRKVLGFPCNFCNHKYHCFPNAEIEFEKGKSGSKPKWVVN